MLIMSLVVAGAASYWQLGIDRFPKMDMPTVFVRTYLPGAASVEVESEVTQWIEDAVSSVEGIDELRSITSEGASLVILTFHLDRDIDAAAQDVRDAINSIRNQLPPDIDPPVIHKSDLEASPILTMAVFGQRDSRELFVLADRYVKDVIESARGVGEVEINGAADRAIKVNIEASRLAAYGLSIMQVREALARQNAEVPGGRIDAGHRELVLRTLGRYRSARDFRDLVVATVNGTPVRLRDLGEVVDGQKEIRNLARLDGEPAVVLEIRRQSGANTIKVVDAIKQRLDRCRALLPDDVDIRIIQDQTRYINAAMHEIQIHLVTGSILASIVVLFFMRSWRSTIIAAVAIPTSIIATFAMMRALDFTLNNVTMLALVLMVGVVIDDAIVVLENIFHAIEEGGLSPVKGAIQGTKEIGLVVLATTLSLVVVFLPVSFLESVAGRFLFQFGLTASVAVLISMLVSFSLTPMMCSRLLRSTDTTDDAPASRRGFYRYLDLAYTACLQWAMRHRLAICVVAALVIASNVPLYHLVRKDYIPTNVDESEFEVRITAPEGASVRSMNVTIFAAEEKLRKIPGVEHLLATIGSTGLARVNYAKIYVRLTDSKKRTFSLTRLLRETLAGRPQAAFQGNFTQRSRMQAVREALSVFPELRASVRNLTSFRQGAPVDIDFAIFGPDLHKLYEYSKQLEAKAAEIPGIVDLYTTLELDKPELRVTIDRRRAADLGVDVREIADTLRVAVGGDDRVSRYRDVALDDVFDVELRLVGIDRDSEASIAQLYVRAAPSSNGDGVEPYAGNGRRSGANLVRIDNLVRFEESQNAARIDRLNRQRMVAVRANISAGYALGDRVEAIEQAAAELGLSRGYNSQIRGSGRELERTIKDFGWAFILSIVFMYLILAAQFEHLTHPLTILVSLPLAVPFGLFSLWLGGETLNLFSALGILVLFGVVKKNAILQVDHTNQLRARGLDRYSAIITANRDRLRPILMVTLSFVAGMLPLVVGTGPGAEERRSIAVLVVGGQTLSLLLTLLATPVIYSLFDDLALLLGHRRKSAADQVAEEADAAEEPWSAKGEPDSLEPQPQPASQSGVR